MTPFYADPHFTLYCADAIEIMRELPGESVDAVVTDPPSGLEFMGKEWDRLIHVHDDHTLVSEGRTVPKFQTATPRYQAGKPMQAWHEVWAREAFRLLKPGGHLLSFGGTRTYHRLACAIEDAGFEIRDCLVWAYASGFPKSLDVGKAIDHAAGAQRKVVEQRRGAGTPGNTFPLNGTYPAGPPATDDAKRWDGWGTALKPAWEPIVMARKPLRGTVAANVLAYGTGALNIDGTRIPTGSEVVARDFDRQRQTPGIANPNGSGGLTGQWQTSARWPANVILTDAIFDGDVPGVVGGGTSEDGVAVNRNRTGDETNGGYGGWAGAVPAGTLDAGYGGGGGMSRFFLIPKEARSGREPLVRGLLEPGIINTATPPGSPGSHSPRAGAGRNGPRENLHPTVKPLELMRHLVRLVTPPGGLVLDPFLGSGTTAIAANAEGFRCIGIEKELEYAEITVARLPGQPLGLGLDVPAATKKRTDSRGKASGYDWSESVNDNPTHVTRNIKSGVHYGDGSFRPSQPARPIAPNSEVWPEDVA
jgi:DNA modification methylase